MISLECGFCDSPTIVEGTALCGPCLLDTERMRQELEMYREVINTLEGFVYISPSGVVTMLHNLDAQKRYVNATEDLVEFLAHG